MLLSFSSSFLYSIPCNSTHPYLYNEASILNEINCCFNQNNKKSWQISVFLQLYPYPLSSHWSWVAPPLYQPFHSSTPESLQLKNPFHPLFLEFLLSHTHTMKLPFIDINFYLNNRTWPTRKFYFVEKTVAVQLMQYIIV